MTPSDFNPTNPNPIDNMSKKSATKPPAYPKVIETFNGSTFGIVRQEEPRVFNGSVTIRKYRITVELVDEPIEVLQARLIDLAEKCDNFHHWTPLKREADRLGMPLETKTFGSKRPNK